MKLEDIALAVLIQLCVSSLTQVSGGRLRHHRRRHGPRTRRVRLGRQEDIITPTTTILPTNPPVERYDLTSYGEDYDSQAPPLSYGAPPPQQDINDVYVGDIPGTEQIILTGDDDDDSGNYDDNLLGAGSDTGKEDSEHEEDDFEEGGVVVSCSVCNLNTV